MRRFLKRPAAASAAPSAKEARSGSGEGQQSFQLRNDTIYEESTLGQYIKKAWDILSDAERCAVVEATGRLGAESCCGLCSGSGMGEIVHHALFTLLGRTNQMSHSCENVGFKQKHLLENVHDKICDDSSCLFVDLEALSSGIGQCLVHRRTCEVKSAPFFLLIGYSCKQLSSLSPTPTSSALPDKLGSSGKTCSAMCDFMAAHRPSLALLENVPEMAKSEEVSRNVAFLHGRLRQIGYEVLVDVFTSSSYMLPQRRQRAFALAINIKAFGLEPEAAQVLLARMLQTAGRLLVPPLPISQFLLPDTHPRVKEELQRRLSERGADPAGNRTQPQRAWQKKHQDFMARKGISWTTLEPPPATKASPSFKTSVAREQEIISCAAALHGESLVAVDVNPSIERAAMICEGIMPTFTTSARYYLMHTDSQHAPRNRYMLGYECLSVQGFPVHFFGDADGPTDPQMADLAGNAFSSTVCAALLLGAYAHVPELAGPRFCTAGSPETVEIGSLEEMDGIRRMFLDM